MTKQQFNINDKYIKKEGKIILTGLQALMRIPIDQYLKDKEKGLNTGTFISGYRGSPIGTLDSIMLQNKKMLEEHHIVFTPGLNEELAATSVWGSQLSSLFDDAKYDGVKGIWYGKGPGVDRSGDALRHANFAGVGKNSGVLALVGDDPISKSSTIPCASEYALYDAMIPVLYPGSIQEIIEFGQLGFELSRYSGLWAGIKCTTDLMDGFGTAIVKDAIEIKTPDFEYKGKPWVHEPRFFPPGPPANVIHEAIMEDGRMNAARAFIRVNNINYISHNPKGAKIGIIAAGKTYYDMIGGLELLGVQKDALEDLGVKILKLGAIYPIDKQVVLEFAEGLDKVIIVEEKRDLIENQITNIIYHSPYKPIIVGKKDENGQSLFPAFGETSPDIIANIFTSQLKGIVPQKSIDNRLDVIKAFDERIEDPILPRTPYYCSGCPHNISTMNVPEGSVVGAGIGCHGMSIIMDGTKVKGITQMGGEGAQWVGLAPFMETNHYFQNLGDGTFSHSGSLAVRHSIASGVNITYKILYNQTVAMTGGQDVETGMTVPEMARMLEAEGVKRIIITTNEVDKYDSSSRWPSISEIWDRDRIIEAQEVLKEVEGVTVLIHDQGCAAELRRKRKRKIVVAPKQRIFINEEVCEGCNDCGMKSNCLSVKAIETDLGRKNIIDQSSCNLDFSCIKGDCPSFLEVIPDPNFKKNNASNDKLDLKLDDLPDPVMRVDSEANLYMMGIGGTGVVTVNQILGTAAILDNKEVNSLDQIGLSQKGGSVISHVKISDKKIEGSNRIAKETADAYIGFDIITAGKEMSLSHASAGKTLAVISTDLTPTGQVLRSKSGKMPAAQRVIDKIEKYTDKEHNIYFDAIKISNVLFGSHYQANIVVIGAAFQAGCIPISAEKIEEAIKINGVGVEVNTMAFRAGRRLAIQPEMIAKLEEMAIIRKDEKKTSKQSQSLIKEANLSDAVNGVLDTRVLELIEYQNVSYAKKYLETVKKVAQKEQAIDPNSTKLTEAVGKYLYKLMAYKDEYEVARLHTKKEAKDAIKKQFGPKAKFAILLHPPILKAMGVTKKVRFGAWTFPMFSLMSKFKFLRGSALDIFGYAEVRKTERALIKEYQQLIDGISNKLTAENHTDMVEAAKLPDMIRGYEDIKMNNVKEYREKVDALKM